MLRSSMRRAFLPLAELATPRSSTIPNKAFRQIFDSQSARRALRQLGDARSARRFQSLTIPRTTRQELVGRVSNYGSPSASTRNVSRRGFRFSAWRGDSANGGKPATPPLSLGDRLKKMAREYGWTAIGVYLTLSVLDFPFFFLLVKWVGTERIGKIEHWVVTTVIPETVRQRWHQFVQSFKKVETEKTGSDEIGEKVEMVGWGVEEAQERNNEEASLATQLALAYAIHKSFIFVRVPLTAAILPKVVKVLRSWGWKIGKRTPKA